MTAPAPPDGALDAFLLHRYGLLAGVDEVGRGALAGPLTVAAVILDPMHPIAGLDDSKRLAARRRAVLAARVRRHCLAMAVVHVAAAEVDRLNVLEATRGAMRRAVLALLPRPGVVVTDAMPLGDLGVPVVAEVGADRLYVSVAAASVVAKVARDRLMEVLASHHRGYGWERNRGYPTRDHLRALLSAGPSPQHRHSFKPVRVLA